MNYQDFLKSKIRCKRCRRRLSLRDSVVMQGEPKRYYCSLACLEEDIDRKVAEALA